MQIKSKKNEVLGDYWHIKKIKILHLHPQKAYTRDNREMSER